MIYNFTEYLKNEFPAETIYCNRRDQLAIQDEVPDRCIFVQESGSSNTQPWTRYTVGTVQCIIRDRDVTKARKLARSVFTKLHGRFGLILPAVTVDGDLFAAVQVAQISAIQTPYCLGADENGRTIYSNNYMVIYLEA